MRKNKLEDLWYDEFRDEATGSHCGLCGNRGIIDNKNANLSTCAGVHVWVKTYCICPNGRALKKGKAVIK